MRWNGYKKTVMRIINLLLYLGGCFLVGTGMLLHFRLPPASRGGRGLELFGLDRHQWGDWHFYVSVFLIGLTVLHLWQNWQWLTKIASRRHFWRLTVGLGFGLLIIGFFLFSPIEYSPGFRH